MSLKYQLWLDTDDRHEEQLTDIVDVKYHRAAMRNGAVSNSTEDTTMEISSVILKFKRLG
jgi:hypothetical protein